MTLPMQDVDRVAIAEHTHAHSDATHASVNLVGPVAVSISVPNLISRSLDIVHLNHSSMTCDSVFEIHKADVPSNCHAVSRDVRG